MLLEVLTGEIINDYKDLFGFKVEFRGNHRITLANPYFKIIFVDQRYDLDVFISDKSERNKVALNSLIEFLQPNLDVALDDKTGLEFDSLIRNYLKDVLTTGDLNWEELTARQNYKHKLHHYIVRNYQPGHELFYLLNSGPQWLRNVQRYMDDHGIEI